MKHPAHIRLFKHFGTEREFSIEDACKFLRIEEDDFADVSLDCRKNALIDCAEFYLCSIGNDECRFIFSRNPKHTTEQFKRQIRADIESRAEAIELLELMIAEGCGDELDLENLKAMYLNDQELVRAQLENEDLERLYKA